jgi:hypothetical protein
MLAATACIVPACRPCRWGQAAAQEEEGEEEEGEEERAADADVSEPGTAAARAGEEGQQQGEQAEGGAGEAAGAGANGRQGRDNASSRRSRLFRQSLVLGALLVHRQWAQPGGTAGVLQQLVGLPPDAAEAAAEAPAGAAEAAAARRAAARAGWDPIQQQAWHPDFPLAEVTLAQVCSCSNHKPATHPAGPLPLRAARTQAAHTTDPPAPAPQVRQAAALHQQQLQRAYQLPDERERAIMRAARPPVSTREAPLCEAGGPLGTEAFLQHLRELPWYEGQVRGWGQAWGGLLGCWPIGLLEGGGGRRAEGGGRRAEGGGRRADSTSPCVHMCSAGLPATLSNQQTAP